MKSALCDANRGWDTCEAMIQSCLAPEVVLQRVEANAATRLQIEAGLKDQQGISFTFAAC